MNPVYHVTWIGSGWAVQDRKSATISIPYATQGDAVVHAKECAVRDGSAQIIVHYKEGGVSSEFFYGREQRPALAFDDSSSKSLAASRTTHARKT